jgi:Ca2+-binding EF-hand superfamily protein
MNFYNSARQNLIAAFEVPSLLLMAALALGAGSAAHAQGATPSTGATNNSAASQMAPLAAAGAIPANKATRMDLDAAFNRADVNRDGQLSRTEAEHFPAVAQRFEQIDSNHDGFISREEFNQAASN